MNQSYLHCFSFLFVDIVPCWIMAGGILLSPFSLLCGCVIVVPIACYFQHVIEVAQLIKISAPWTVIVGPATKMVAPNRSVSTNNKDLSHFHPRFPSPFPVFSGSWLDGIKKKLTCCWYTNTSVTVTETCVFNLTRFVKHQCSWLILYYKIPFGIHIINHWSVVSFAFTSVC